MLSGKIGYVAPVGAPSPFAFAKMQCERRRDGKRDGEEQQGGGEVSGGPFNWPTMTDPANPPQLPMELISASPAACTCAGQD